MRQQQHKREWLHGYYPNGEDDLPDGFNRHDPKYQR
jgi:hypothetical protein